MQFSKKRYRRFVFISKILAGLVVCLLISSFGYKMLRKSDDASESESSKNTHNQYGIKVIDTVFEGFDTHGREYNIASKSMLKANGGTYYMNDVIGQYDLQEQKLDIKSLSGEMDDASKILKLKDNVVMLYDGYSLYTDQLDVDLKLMIAKNDNKVTALRGNSAIKADRFDAESDSGIIRFEGNVTTHLKLTDF